LNTEGRRAGFEIRTVLIVVVAILIVGALYALLTGSPAKKTQAADSPNAPQAPMYTKVPSASPSTANTTAPSKN
jgi:flagellar basal body-associated protein FliL